MDDNQGQEIAADVHSTLEDIVHDSISPSFFEEAARQFSATLLGAEFIKPLGKAISEVAASLMMRKLLTPDAIQQTLAISDLLKPKMNEGNFNQLKKDKDDLIKERDLLKEKLARLEDELASLKNDLKAGGNDQERFSNVVEEKNKEKAEKRNLEKKLKEKEAAHASDVEQLKNGMSQIVASVSVSDVESATKSTKVLTTPEVTDTDSQTETEMDTDIEIPISPKCPQPTTVTPQIPRPSISTEKPEKALSTASVTKLPPSVAGDTRPATPVEKPKKTTTEKLKKISEKPAVEKSKSKTVPAQVPEKSKSSTPAAAVPSTSKQPEKMKVSEDDATVPPPVEPKELTKRDKKILRLKEALIPELQDYAEIFIDNEEKVDNVEFTIARFEFPRAGEKKKSKDDRQDRMISDSDSDDDTESSDDEPQDKRNRIGMSSSSDDEPAAEVVSMDSEIEEDTAESSSDSDSSDASDAESEPEAAPLSPSANVLDNIIGSSGNATLSKFIKKKPQLYTTSDAWDQVMPTNQKFGVSQTEISQMVQPRTAAAIDSQRQFSILRHAPEQSLRQSFKQRKELNIPQPEQPLGTGY